MADEDKLNGLTRRRVLGGMATIGVAAGAGGATWASIQDTETIQATASAGSLDLVIIKGDEVFNGGSCPIGTGPLSNGGEVTRTLTLKNTGSIRGETICFSIPDGNIGNESRPLEYKENGQVESEKQVDNSEDIGELQNFLNLDIDLTDGSSTYQVFDGNFLDLVGDKTCVDEGFRLSSGDEATLSITFSVDETDISSAQTDSVLFNLNATLKDV